ncbi:MAG: DNA repair protein RecO, partial [Rhodospirillales bacterium]
MEWTDEGLILSARRHGENAAIVTLLTAEHGLHAGLVRGHGAKGRGAVEPGTQVRAHWRARLPDHLGHFRLESDRAYAAPLLADAEALAGLSAACAVAERALPEREPHRPVYDGLLTLMEALGARGWGALLVTWELGLLAELGFGLDLSVCAATGTREDLVWVSPKTGRAVSRAAGGPYAERLLVLPGFLAGGRVAEADAAEILTGLLLTGHFLDKL